MDEEKTTEGEKSTEPAGDIKEGDKYETTPIIERAREEREKLEAAVKAQKAENDRTELIMAKQALGGKTEAGGTPVAKETPEEYAARFMRGEANPLVDDGVESK